MKKSVSLLSSFVLLCVLFLSSCSKVPSSARLIPKDASIVVRVDLKQIADKADTGGDDGMKAQLKQAIKDSGMSRGAVDLLTSIVEKPKKLGIDLRDPVFIYMRDKQKGGLDDLFGEAEDDDALLAEEDPLDVDGEEMYDDTVGYDPHLNGNWLAESSDDVEIGVIATMYDADDFAEVIRSLQKELDVKLQEADGGVRYIAMDEAVLVFDDDNLFITTATQMESDDDLLRRAKAQLKQEKSASLAGNRFLKTACKKDGDIQILWLGQSVAGNPVYQSLAMMMVSKDCSFADLASVVDINMLDGETLITTETLYGSKVWKKFAEKWSDAVGDINGDLAEYIPDDADFTLAFNLNGKKIVEQLRSLAIVKTLPAEMTKNIFGILATINGDAMMAADINKENGKLERLSFYSHTTDGKIARFLAEDMMDEDAEKTGTDTYIIHSDSLNVDMGWKNGIFYAVEGKDNKPFTKAGKPCNVDVMKKRSMYARLNVSVFTQGKETISEDTKMDELIARRFADKFECIEIYTPGDNKCVVRIVQKDKEKPLIALISHFFTHLPEEMMQLASSLPTGTSEPTDEVIDSI